MKVSVAEFIELDSIYSKKLTSSIEKFDDVIIGVKDFDNNSQGIFQGNKANYIRDDLSNTFNPIHSFYYEIADKMRSSLEMISVKAKRDFGVNGYIDTDEVKRIRDLTSSQVMQKIEYLELVNRTINDVKDTIFINQLKVHEISKSINDHTKYCNDVIDKVVEFNYYIYSQMCGIENLFKNQYTFGNNSAIYDGLSKLQIEEGSSYEDYLEGIYGPIIVPVGVKYKDREKYFKGLYDSVMRMDEQGLPQSVITTFLEDCSKIKSNNIEKVVADIYDWEGRNVFDYIFNYIDNGEEWNDAVKYSYDKKTNTIKINVNFVQKGKNTYSFSETESDFELFVRFVEEEWSQDNIDIFGYNTSVKVDGTDNNTYSGLRENVNVKTYTWNSDSSKKQVSHVKYGPFGWSPNNVGDVKMYSGYSKKGKDGEAYSEYDYRIVAAHEAGHIFGIGDGYRDGYDQGSIMDEPWLYKSTQSLDYEKMIGAFVAGEQQEMRFEDKKGNPIKKDNENKKHVKEFEEISLDLNEIIEIINND